jgi:hypothetical protein
MAHDRGAGPRGCPLCKEHVSASEIKSVVVSHTPRLHEGARLNMIFLVLAVLCQQTLT